MYQWCEFKSRRGKNKNVSAQTSNSNTVGLNVQTLYCKYIDQLIIRIEEVYTNIRSLLGTVFPDES